MYASNDVLVNFLMLPVSDQRIVQSNLRNRGFTYTGEISTRLRNAKLINHRNLLSKKTHAMVSNYFANPESPLYKNAALVVSALSNLDKLKKQTAERLYEQLDLGEMDFSKSTFLPELKTLNLVDNEGKMDPEVFTAVYQQKHFVLKSVTTDVTKQKFHEMCCSAKRYEQKRLKTLFKYYQGIHTLINKTEVRATLSKYGLYTPGTRLKDLSVVKAFFNNLPDADPLFTMRKKKKPCLEVNHFIQEVSRACITLFHQ